MARDTGCRDASFLVPTSRPPRAKVVAARIDAPDSQSKNPETSEPPLIVEA